AEAASASSRPSPVSVTPRAWRRNRVTPRPDSSLRTWWLTALAVRCSSSAACAKFWWRAAAANTPRDGSRPERRFIPITSRDTSQICGLVEKYALAAVPGPARIRGRPPQDSWHVDARLHARRHHRPSAGGRARLDDAAGADRAGRDLGRLVPVHARGRERLRRGAAGRGAPGARRAGAAAVPVARAGAFPRAAVAEAGVDRHDQL